MSTENEVRKTRGSIPKFLEMKRKGERIVVLTAYDYLFARYVEEAKVDLLLIGDSLGQLVLGYPSTIPVTLEEMTDASLLGGVKIVLGSQMIDGSLRRRLEDLGETLYRVQLGAD